MKKTKYELLMVNYDSKTEEIITNFRKLAKQIHPDGKNPEEELIATKQMQELIEAYKTLIDENKRTKYNASLTKEEISRINETYNQEHKNNPEKEKAKNLDENWIAKYRQHQYIIRSYYEITIGYKYCQINNQEGFILENLNTGEQIQCMEDCYKKYFKKELFPKNLYLPKIYHYIPFQKEHEGIESRLIWFKDNIYIWRKNGAYREIGAHNEFIIENCFIYHKPTKKSFFYECYTGKIVEITGFLPIPIPPENELTQKEPKKLSLIRK